MTEKKGFFRRVFSFGQPEEPAPREPAAPAPSRAEPVEAQDASGDVLQDDVVEESPGADLPGTQDEEPAETSPDTADPATVLVAEEPEWLDPDAPEPEADFSWLEDDHGGTDISAERPADTFAADAPPDDAPVLGSEAASDGGEAADVAPRTVPASPLGAPPSIVAPPPPAASDEPDFSFLDPDAPLPAEEEEADFSWLAPEAPLPEQRGGETGSIGAAGIAATGASARPSTGEGGWRLREAPAAVAAPAAAPRTTFIERLREGLSRSSNQLSGSITALFTKRRLDEATLQDFEDVLLQADLGVETALRITDRLSEGRFGKEITGAEVRTILADEVEATLNPVALPLELDLEKKPHVILVVGVNGTGKTTTIGKLAAKLTRGGLKVTLCAGDTFRAAAVEQLKIWGERTGSEVVAKAIGADAAGLAFEAYDRAVENESDVLIIDTAGRLQNKAELMAELEKIVRVLQKREPDAPHTVLQTLDATTGQNALSQVEIFRNVAGVNGLVMTKLDGTARGGILVAIAAKYRLPVYFIGVGEGIDDLEPFKARDFALAIAGKG